MTLVERFLRRGDILTAAVMGFVDGILTALTLAASLLVGDHDTRSLTLDYALRIAVGASVSGVFVYFVAKYAEFRRQLVRAERELSLVSGGQLAATNLGRAVARECAVSAVVSGLTSFTGALVPLCIGVAFPRYPWIAAGASLIALGLLGAALAKGVYGSAVKWCLTLILGGALLTAIGVKLAIL